MTYTTATAAASIVTILTRNAPYGMRVADVARAAYLAWANDNGSDAAAEVVVTHGTRRVRRFIRIGYTAIANLKRAGRVLAQRGGRVRIDTASVHVTPGAAPAVAVATPVSAAAEPLRGSVRATFDSFMAAVDGDAGRWIAAFDVSEADRQVTAVRSLRAMLDAAEALLAEEGVAV